MPSSGATLTGKTAIVIGGTRGIGGAISRRLAAQDAVVAMFYHSRRDEAEALAADLSKDAPGTFALPCDVADTAALDAALDAAIAQLGRLDILVCNAGLTIVGPLADYADDAFDRAFAVNARAPFLAARKAAKVMADGGRILMIGTVLADRVPGPGATLYAASKAALGGMVRGIARDLAERRITANLIQPGPIATERNPVGGQRGQIANSPLAIRRHGTAEEVAACAAYLVSPEAAFVTGGVHNVDGGWCA